MLTDLNPELSQRAAVAAALESAAFMLDALNRAGIDPADWPADAQIGRQHLEANLKRAGFAEAYAEG